jgi:hypothetical protein
MEKEIVTKTDQKIVVSLQVKNGTNVYTFTMPYQSPLQEAYDALQAMISDLMDMSERAKKIQEENKKKEEESAIEESATEESTTE